MHPCLPGASVRVETLKAAISVSKGRGEPEHLLRSPTGGFGKWAFLPRLAVGSLAVGTFMLWWSFVFSLTWDNVGPWEESQ